MKYGIKDEMWDSIRTVLSKNSNIQKAVLFGSRAKGTAKKFSDIDLSLFGDKLTHTDLAKTISALEDLPSPYMFDICLYAMLKNKDIREHIDRCGVVIYDKK